MLLSKWQETEFAAWIYTIHFKIESNKDSGVLHLSEKLFNEILKLKNLQHYNLVLLELLDDFKKTVKEKNFLSLNIFNIGNWVTSKNHILKLNPEKDTYTLGRKLWWNFDLLFGTNNAVYYSIWTSNYFELKFTKK